jgi:hypothetical protein
MSEIISTMDAQENAHAMLNEARIRREKEGNTDGKGK